jgi:hypothetical protein
MLRCCIGGWHDWRCVILLFWGWLISGYPPKLRRLACAGNGSFTAQCHILESTEVTYVSSPPAAFNGPAYNGNGENIHVLGNIYPQTALPPVPRGNFYVPSSMQQQTHHEISLAAPSSNTTKATWPFSPITMIGQNGNLRRECDSPAVTNDYASMIQGEINGGAQFDPSEATTLQKAHRVGDNTKVHLQPKLRSVSPPPPNTPNTLSGSSICLIPPPHMQKLSGR